MANIFDWNFDILFF